jgi:hypothetical protein
MGSPDEQKNIAPMLRYICTGIAVMTCGLIFLVGGQGGSADLFATLFCMALLVILTIGIIAVLNGEWAKSKVIRLPKKRDDLVT